MRIGRRGIAGLEFALFAPMLTLMLMCTADISAALISQAQISRAVGSAGAYATLAGQNPSPPAFTTITANASTLAGGVANGWLGAPTVTSVINNGNGTTAKCCPGATWACSTASGYACADGSAALVYIKVTATYPFQAMFPFDATVFGLSSLTDTIVAPLQ